MNDQKAPISIVVALAVITALGLSLAQKANSQTETQSLGKVPAVVRSTAGPRTGSDGCGARSSCEDRAWRTAHGDPAPCDSRR